MKIQWPALLHRAAIKMNGTMKDTMRHLSNAPFYENQRRCNIYILSMVYISMMKTH